jgi:hypothetical protein
MVLTREMDSMGKMQKLNVKDCCILTNADYVLRVWKTIRSVMLLVSAVDNFKNLIGYVFCYSRRKIYGLWSFAQLRGYLA